jgi:hypothetical protein
MLQMFQPEAEDRVNAVFSESAQREWPHRVVWIAIEVQRPRYLWVGMNVCDAKP